MRDIVAKDMREWISFVLFWICDDEIDCEKHIVMLGEESTFDRSTVPSEFDSGANGIVNTPYKNGAAAASSFIAFPAASSTIAVEIPELDPLKGGLYEGR